MKILAPAPSKNPDSNQKPRLQPALATLVKIRQLKLCVKYKVHQSNLIHCTYHLYSQTQNLSLVTPACGFSQSQIPMSA